MEGPEQRHETGAWRGRAYEAKDTNGMVMRKGMGGGVTPAQMGADGKAEEWPYWVSAYPGAS